MFIDKYLENLTRRLMNIGEWKPSKEMGHSIGSFKLFFCKFFEENKDNICFKYLKKNNLFVKHLIEEFKIAMTEENEIDINFMTVIPTTCNVETSFSVLKHKKQFNQSDSTKKSKMILTYNILGNGHEYFTHDNTNLCDKLQYPFLDLENDCKNSDNASEFEGY